MTEIAGRYRRLCGSFVDKVSQVSPERWQFPFECTVNVDGPERAGTAFDGPPVDVATDADDQTKLLALLGRHV